MGNSPAKLLERFHHGVVKGDVVAVAECLSLITHAAEASPLWKPFLDPETETTATPISHALRATNVPLALELLRGGEPVTSLVMHQAASTPGCASLVPVLVSRGGDVNATNEKGDTPLATAAECDHVDAVHALLSVGADANLAHPIGRAAGRGCVPIVRALLEAGADVRFVDSEVSDSDEHAAVSAVALARENGHDDVVTLLQTFVADSVAGEGGMEGGGDGGEEAHGGGQSDVCGHGGSQGRSDSDVRVDPTSTPSSNRSFSSGDEDAPDACDVGPSPVLRVELGNIATDTTSGVESIGQEEGGLKPSLRLGDAQLRMLWDNLLQAPASLGAVLEEPRQYVRAHSQLVVHLQPLRHLNASVPRLRSSTEPSGIVPARLAQLRGHEASDAEDVDMDPGAPGDSSSGSQRSLPGKASPMSQSGTITLASDLLSPRSHAASGSRYVWLLRTAIIVTRLLLPADVLVRGQCDVDPLAQKQEYQWHASLCDAKMLPAVVRKRKSLSTARCDEIVLRFMGLRSELKLRPGQSTLVGSLSLSDWRSKLHRCFTSVAHDKERATRDAWEALHRPQCPLCNEPFSARYRPYSCVTCDRTVCHWCGEYAILACFGERRPKERCSECLGERLDANPATRRDAEWLAKEKQRVLASRQRIKQQQADAMAAKSGGDGDDGDDAPGVVASPLLASGSHEVKQGSEQGS